VKRKPIEYLTLEAQMPRGELGRAHAAIFTRGEQIRQIGLMLQDLHGVGMGHESDRIRETATRLRAGATHALLEAAKAMELAGSLDGIARILEAEQRK
jgi:hypothetical protein